MLLTRPGIKRLSNKGKLGLIMKNWRRKIQNLFSCKRNTLSSTAYDGTIMIGQQTDRVTSQHRKLPPTPKLSITSPMTIRKKSEVQTHFSQVQNRKATNCKENLGKQEKPQETVHDNAIKYCLKGGNGTNITKRITLKPTAANDRCRIKSNTTKKTQANVKDTLFVPEILISHAENDDDFGQMFRSKNVYVCGRVDNDMWHRLLVDLCREFSVRCISPTEYPECNKWLSRTHVFVFLMDDVSVLEPAFKDQLRLAIMLGLDVVYVRDLSFELKTVEKTDSIMTSGNGKSCSSVEQADPEQKVGLTVKQHENERRYNSSVDKNEDEYLESVDLDTVIHPNNLSVIKNKHDSSMPNVRSCNKSDFQLNNPCRGTYSEEKCCKISPIGEIDINEVIESEYGTSLVYHDLYHSKCLERIISSIKSHGPNGLSDTTSLANSQQSLMSTAMFLDESSRSVSCDDLSQNESRRYLHTPALSMYSSVSNDSAVGDMFHVTSPVPNVLEADDHFSIERPFSQNDIPLQSRKFSQSEAIYIVSPDNNFENIKFFRWPEDVEKEVIANSPSIDSLGFQDIDLSKRVNEIDLFDGNISD